jgi:hypothetical protein
LGLRAMWGRERGPALLLVFNCCLGDESRKKKPPIVQSAMTLRNIGLLKHWC